MHNHTVLFWFLKSDTFFIFNSTIVTGENILNLWLWLRNVHNFLWSHVWDLSPKLLDPWQEDQAGRSYLFWEGWQERVDEGTSSGVLQFSGNMWFAITYYLFYVICKRSLKASNIKRWFDKCMLHACFETSHWAPLICAINTA